MSIIIQTGGIITTCALQGLCCTNQLKDELPLSPDGLAYCLCDRHAESGVVVRDGDADLDFRDLTFEVPCHEALAQQFHAVHPLTDRVMRSMIPRGFVSTRLRRW